MSNNNLRAIGDGVFVVSELVGLRLPRVAWLWHFEDIDEAGARGSIIRTWGEREPEGLDIAYMLAADVTGDPTEPDVTTLQSDGFNGTGRRLREGIATSLQGQGMWIVEWQMCELAVSAVGKGMFCTYIAMDQGKDRQYVALRFGVHNRKAIVIACYDVSQAQILGPLTFRALYSSFVMTEEPVMIGTLFGAKLEVPGLYTGGSGESVETAIILNTKDRSVGVWAEYAYIERLHGRRNSGWRTLEQELKFGEDGRPYDVLRIQLRDSSVLTYNFDVSAFYGIQRDRADIKKRRKAWRV